RDPRHRRQTRPRTSQGERRPTRQPQSPRPPRRRSHHPRLATRPRSTAHRLPRTTRQPHPIKINYRYLHRQVDKLENGVEHLLTQPRSPTTTGKIERFHRTLRVEFDTRQVFRSLKHAQSALDEWVEDYNTNRPHQSLEDATPASRFQNTDAARVPAQRSPDERTGEQWVARKVAANGVVCVNWQQVS